MPNGGSDCCETCWFNSRHEGKKGYGDGLPCVCVIRGESIMNTYWTYCANHPHHNTKKVSVPVGPIYECGDPVEGGPIYPRVAKCPSPDNEEVRRGLLDLLDGLEEPPPEEYPSPTRFEDEVIVQLGAFGERRAVPGLRRVLKFRPFARAPVGRGTPNEVIFVPDPVVDRQSTIGRAMEALAKILGAEAIPDIAPFVSAGLDDGGKPLEVYEKLAQLRFWAVVALCDCGPEAREHLERAAKDPVPGVAARARMALES